VATRALLLPVRVVARFPESSRHGATWAKGRPNKSHPDERLLKEEPDSLVLLYLVHRTTHSSLRFEQNAR